MNIKRTGTLVNLHYKLIWNDLMPYSFYYAICYATVLTLCKKCLNKEFLLVHIFSVFRLDMDIYGVNLCIQSEYGKMPTRINSILVHLSGSVILYHYIRLILSSQLQTVQTVFTFEGISVPMFLQNCFYK